MPPLGLSDKLTNVTKTNVHEVMVIHYLDTERYLRGRTLSLRIQIQYSSQNGPTNKLLTRFYSEHKTHTHTHTKVETASASRDLRIQFR